MYVCHTNQIRSTMNNGSNFLFFSHKGLFDTCFSQGSTVNFCLRISPLVPTRCLLFLVTNGNLTLFVFHKGVRIVHHLFPQDVCYF